ncbi:HAD domain-containing protein [Arthrobacter sp. NPDC058288]|uniref:HAD domain-containing protein n=1 Tax=Arthrobacter sp. NPDC058288 TaxID=3346424 RepID=UPI0036E52DEA
MNPIILLDIDGVLNPVVRTVVRGDRPELSLHNARLALVRRLARCGRIAWVSTWPADLLADLESQLHLEVTPLRVTLALRSGDGDERTPKLRSVVRWLTRMEALGEADWDAVVWVDDALGPDVREWAHDSRVPVHLVKPSPEEGLTREQVASVESLVGGGR